MPLQPFVKMLSKLDDREVAWRISRPQIKEEEVVDLLPLTSSDFAINDNCYVRLHIRSSIIFRELLMIVRPLDIWSQSSRVNPIAETMMSGEYEGELLQDKFAEIVSQCSSDPRGQDVARLNLPLAAVGEYIVGTNWRTWICFLKALKRLSPKTFNVYGTLFMEALGVDDLDFFNYDRQGGMDHSLAMSEKDMIQPNGVKDAYGTTMMKCETTFTHASHLVRHQRNAFRSNIWNLIEEPLENHVSMNLLTPVTIITSMPTGSYRSILSHRSDWLASWNDWAGFVESGTAHMTDEEFWNFLEPAENYKSDNEARIELTDPNLPNPIIISNPDMVRQRIACEGSNYIAERWLNFVERGWIKDDPSNESRVQYEKNLRDVGRQSIITW